MLKQTIRVSTILMLTMFCLFFYKNAYSSDFSRQSVPIVSVSDTEQPSTDNLPKMKIYYFGTNTCSTCLKTKDFLKDFESRYSNTFKTEFTDGFEIIFTETTEEQGKVLHESYSKAYGVPLEQFNIVPAMFIGDKYLIDLEPIQSNLYGILKEYSSGEKVYEEKDVNIISTQEVHEVQTEKFNGITFFGILYSGLLDGFNPCAMAMLMFFLTFLISTKKSNKALLLTGFCYILGTFITYFGIGLGLFKFSTIIINAVPIMITIYTITILLSLFLAVQSLRDYKSIKAGDYSKVKLQLPKFMKHTIHKYIRNNISNQAIYLSALIAGIVVSVLEFFCTGQIYLPTIVYMISSQGSGTAIFYLLLYNLAFVFPLIVICFMIYRGKAVMEVSNTLVSKLDKIKLLSAIFFFVISLIMISQILKIV